MGSIIRRLFQPSQYLLHEDDNGKEKKEFTSVPFDTMKSN